MKLGALAIALVVLGSFVGCRRNSAKGPLPEAPIGTTTTMTHSETMNTTSASASGAMSATGVGGGPSPCPSESATK